METVNLNLAHRWFIGYDLEKPVPDHSSLSKIRERYGLGVLQHFFEKVVELCIEAGLVWGEELYFDSTKVQANASVKGLIDRTEHKVQQHLEEDPSSFGSLIAKYNGERIKGIRKPRYQRITDEQISPTDPDAAPMQPSGGGSAVLGYRDHYVVDGGKTRIILSALITPASITDNTPILDLIDWICSRWKIGPRLAVGDARYGTTPNIVGFEKRGIKAYLATPDLSNRTRYYPAKLFQYDSEKDHYICSQGQTLPLFSRRKTEQVFVYKPKAEVCNACSVKSECTGSKSGRHIFRSFFQEYLGQGSDVSPNRSLPKSHAYAGGVGRAFIWRCEGVPPSETLSVETVTQGEYRRSDDGSGAKLEKIDQAQTLYSFFFVQNCFSKAIYPPIFDFFNGLIGAASFV